MQCYPQKPYSSGESKQYSMSSSSSASSQQGGYGNGHGGYQQQYGSSAGAAGLGGAQYQQQYGSSTAGAAGFGLGGGGGAQQQQQYQQQYGSASVMSGGGGGGGGGVQQQLLKTSSFQSTQSQTLTVFGNDPFCDISPSAFPPGTDLKVIECFNRIDKDGNGVIDDREFQAVLSSCNHAFSLRTVHLLMYQFTHSNKRMIGPKEFVPLMQCLQSWKTMFQRFDRDRNGSINSMELGSAFNSLGYCVSPMIVNLLIAKFTKSFGGRCSLQYDQFIECCLTVKGLTETFKAREECGRASFTYEEFLLNVLPFIIA